MPQTKYKVKVKNNLTSKFFSLLTLILLLTAATAWGQNGKIVGKVSDKGFNEPIVGLPVMVKGTQKVAPTNIEGRYELNLAPGTYTLEFKYVSFKSKAISEVIVKPGKVTELNVVMEETATELGEVVVASTFKKESVNALYSLQKNSPLVTDGISAEIIKKTPDRNTAEVLKRVSGTTIQENKFVVVRGLSDRYNTAALNGTILPSTEPDRKAFSFDIIPSNLIDNIIINKTASPDLPGDFSGGAVTVITKDIPDESYLSFSIGTSYNPQSTFKDFYTSANGSNLTNMYLGFTGDVGKIPAGFPASRSDYNQQVVNDPSKAVSLSKLFPNSWQTYANTALPTQNYQINWGAVKHNSNGSKFGSMLSFSYRNSQGIEDRNLKDYESNIQALDYDDQVYKFTTNIGVLANFGYARGRSKYSFKNLINKSLDNKTTFRAGDNTTDKLRYYNGYSFDPLEKLLINSSLDGDHLIGKKNMKLDWDLNYVRTDRDQPDLRNLLYGRPINDDSAPLQAEVPTGGSASRNTSHFYSNLVENAYGGNVSLSIPLTMFKNKSLFKLGGVTQVKTRDFSARILGYVLDVNNQQLSELPHGIIFDESNINDTGFTLNEITNNTDKYDATSALFGGYAMLDNKLSEKVRLVWGVRTESYLQDVNTYDKSTGAPYKSKRTYFDILPSVNLTFSPNVKSNIRLSASQTVSRPELREVSNFGFYDFITNSSISGNPELESGKNLNLDLRYEIFPSAGEIASLSVFYKRFKNPIEQIIESGSTANSRRRSYQNINNAQNYGVELELRKRLNFIGDGAFFNDLTIYTNLAYIKSKLDFEGVNNVFDRDRALQGQSPYIINAGLGYNNTNAGLSANLLYNRIGQRISDVGFDGYGDIYENYRNVIDFQLSKQIIKGKGELKLNINDLLNEAQIFYQNNGDMSKRSFDSGSDNIMAKTRYGTSFSLSFAYRFSLGKGN